MSVIPTPTNAPIIAWITILPVPGSMYANASRTGKRNKNEIIEIFLIIMLLKFKIWYKNQDFMSSFNDVYYSFSPVIADYERENPMFGEMVKVAITPIVSSLSILNYVDMDSEESVLGYRISLIVLNAMMYVGIPIAGIVAVKNNGMYISLAHNKATGNPVNKKETDRFYEMVDDIKKGDHGTILTDAVYGSSVGFKKEALEDLTALSKSRDNDPENKLDFKIANFENNIYSVIN